MHIILLVQHDVTYLDKTIHHYWDIMRIIYKKTQME